MGADYLTKSRIVLAGIEATPGTEQPLNVADNAILVSEPRVSPAFENVEDNTEVTGTLDSRGPIVGGGNMPITFGARLKGSGSAGTPPEAGILYRGCAMAETVTATAETGTAQGGTAQTIQLAATASAVDGAYVGMPIRITGGTGDGASSVIVAYNGTSKTATVVPEWSTPPDATSQYSIDANVRYGPASTALENLTLYRYQNSRAAGGQSHLVKIVGAAGTFSLEMGPRNIGRSAFNFAGILPELPTNVAPPGDPNYDAMRAPPFQKAVAHMGGKPVRFNRLTVDYGAEVSQADDPAAAYGFGPASATNRRITGTINPQMELLSVRNNMSDFLNGVAQPLVFSWGVAGNLVTLTLPSVKFTGDDDEDVGGYASEGLAFEAAGEGDDGLFLAFG